MKSRLWTAIGWRVSWLGWRIVSIPRRRTVRVKRLGLDLELDLRDIVQYSVYREGSYEPELADRINGAIRPGDVYVDIGAHIGIHALVVARELQRLGGGHVYAFEPAPDSADRLAKAVERNAISNLSLVRAAVGATAGRIELRIGGPYGQDMAAMRSAFGFGQAVAEVPVLRFDEWARKAELARLDLIKLDIEGGELAALVGMRETLTRLRPRLIFIEVNRETLKHAGVTEERLYAELIRSGYAVREKLHEFDHLDNVVFVRMEGPS